MLSAEKEEVDREVEEDEEEEEEGVETTESLQSDGPEYHTSKIIELNYTIYSSYV